MKIKIALILVCLICLACENSCASETAVPLETDSTHPAIQQKPSTSTKVVSNIIAEIRQSPEDFVGEPVEIIGYFHGWDLFNEMNDSPPVTRSDWVLADDSGAIYVTGMLPLNLDPSLRDQTGVVIRLTATVVTSQGQVYLEALSIEVISE